MVGRVQRVFGRYAARHLVVSRPGLQLCDAAARAVGEITSISLRNDRLVVEGQCAADLVMLELDGRHRVRVPGADGIAGGIGAAAHRGRFRLDLPYAPGPAVFSLTLDGETAATPLPGFSGMRLQLARLALWPRFGIASLWALPAAWRWLRHHDMGARARVKKLLGLGEMVEEMQLDPDILPPDIPPPVAPPPVALAGSAISSAPSSGVSIVLPVYQAFDLLPEVLDRLRRHTDLPWRLIVIEDASPDPRIRPFLCDWALAQNQTGTGDTVHLIGNAVNLGFIGSVNLGLAMAASLAPEAPVILLNADAFVPAAWASRLVAPLLADPGVASVTPMSNDAELMSVPVICQRSDLPPGAGDAIDAVARRLGPRTGDLAEAPTGVGFCMALSPAFLARVPGFDPAFGRGYGEEVDWCQKVRALNGRHLCLPGLFVEHRGGASFGAAAKQALLRQNGALISARHPRFDADVQRFIGDDPLATARLALGLAAAGAGAAHAAAAAHTAASAKESDETDAGETDAGETDARIPVYLAHSMGGGAEHYLRGRVGQDINRTGAAVVLRVGGEYRWEISLHTRQGVTRGGTSDRALMLRLLCILPARVVIYSCGVADPDPVELPAVLLALAQDQRLEVLIHDYLPISPSYTLLDAGSAFRGVPGGAGMGGQAHPPPAHPPPAHPPAHPPAEAIRPAPAQAGLLPRARAHEILLPRARAHEIMRPDGRRVDLAEWQAAWRPMLEAAAEVVVFSQASFDLMQAAYPRLASSLRLRPHAVPHKLPKLMKARAPALAPALAPAQPVIGVLGNIGLHKGAGVLVVLSKRLAQLRRKSPVADLVVPGLVVPGLVVLGHVDPAYDLARPARIHGAYEVPQIPDLVARYGITCWLIPSIWPETFSYTTHEALATGLPVICFDLGAQAEAVAGAIAKGAPGAVLPLTNGRPDVEALLKQVQQLCASR